MDRAHLWVTKVRMPMLAIACLVVMALNIALVIQNRTLKRQMGSGIPSQLPPVGLTLPPVEGTAPGGLRTTMPYEKGGKKTVLFVFSPSCHVCTQNWANWTSVANLADPHSTRLVYLNILQGGSDESFRQYAMNSVLIEADPKTIEAYNLRYTPETILINPEGRILRAWIGFLDQRALAEIGSVLKSNQSAIRSDLGGGDQMIYYNLASIEASVVF